MPSKDTKDRRRSGFGYIGRISNAGAQRVVAPINNNGKKGTTTVKTGGDLRTK